MKTCYHCSGKCDTEIPFDNKIFCCEGCKTIYDILSTNELGKYYDIDKNPGLKATKNFEGKYNFLDLEEFRAKLLIFSENSISKISLFLPQIHCSSCLWLLERLHKLRKGIIQSQVDFVQKKVEITFDEKQISLRELAELLASIGYPPSISMKDLEGKKKSVNQASRRLIVQIGIAGFCFGNMMLISFPEYLGLDESDKNFQTLFNYLNLALSVPVLLFGARDYLVSAWKAVTNKIINIDIPISLGIIAFYLQSLYEILSGTGAGYLDSFAGLIFFLLIGKWFQQATYGAINFERDYKSYFPIAVSKKVDDKEEIVPLSTLKIGDRLVIRNNELIPADAVLVTGTARVDYSFVTGESALVTKNPGDKLFAGGRQEGQIIEIILEREVQNSYLTKLWNNPLFDKEKINTSFTETITKYFTVIIIFLAIFGALFWLWADASKSLFVVVSVLIIACPCAIALSLPFTYGNGIRILGKKSFFLRSSKVIESIADVTDIVFDKTGTLTLANESQITWIGESLSDEDKKNISAIVSQSAHPLSRKISNFLNSETTNKIQNLAEISGKGLTAEINNQHYKIGSSSFVSETNNSEGTTVFVKKNETLLGYFSFSNVYRSGVNELMNNLSPQFQIHVLSGDNISEKVQLEKFMPVSTQYNFNQSPSDKMEYISALQKQGKKVMMIGDGLNDAGALRQSNVGVSVVDDVYSFSPSSDGIIDGKQLHQLLNFIEFCRYNKRVVKISYAFSIFYNLIGLSFALTANLTPLVAAVLMPISSISVVILVTVLTNLRGKKLSES